MGTFGCELRENESRHRWRRLSMVVAWSESTAMEP
jgi:hypothetical protein